MNSNNITTQKYVYNKQSTPKKYKYFHIIHNCIINGENLPGTKVIAGITDTFQIV